MTTTKKVKIPVSGPFGKASCCAVEALVTVDEWGQMVLPKELRAKAGIKAGDKLAVTSWEKNHRISLPRFTVIGATTQLSLLAGPLRDRFGARFRLDYYDQPAMEAIIDRAATMLNIEIRPEGLSEIARRSRGTPRVGLRLLRRSRDYAQTRADGIISGPVAGEALELMGIDFLGLDDIDRRVLHAIIVSYEAWFEIEPQRAPGPMRLLQGEHERGDQQQRA